MLGTGWGTQPARRLLWNAGLFVFDREGRTMPQAFRIPADDAYTAMLGRAVYNFTYYEWVVVNTIEKIKPGYLRWYSSEGPTAGRVGATFVSEAAGYQADPSIIAELNACAATFNHLRTTRNQLLHAHPYTAADGAQQLDYRGHHPNANWPMGEVEAAARQFDDAACALNELFYRQWP